MPLISAKKFVASVATAHTAVSDGPNDVCKTPAAPSPLPMPYPNIAVSTTMGGGYATKVLVLATPTWTKNGKTAISNGDQPGVLEDPQMLGDRRLAHGEGRRDVAGGVLALAEQALDDGEPGGVGEGAEDGGKGDLLHGRSYLTAELIAGL